MPNIQVVVSQSPDTKGLEIVYIGYDRVKAIEIFYKENKHSFGYCGVLETDEDTVIELTIGGNEHAELVKRATPMKPHVYTLFITDGPRNHVWNREISENRCGSCDKKIDRDFAFCPYCGQAIDWSDK